MGKRGPKGDKLISDALRVAMLRDSKVADQDGKALSRVYAMAEKIAEKAENGDEWAASFVTDRLEGKPKQAVEHAGEDGGDIGIIHRISLIGVRPER